MAFAIFTPDLLLSFYKFATYLQRANLCKYVFSSSKTYVKFCHDFAELYPLNKSPSNLAPVLISRRSFQPVDGVSLATPCQQLKKPRKGLFELLHVVTN